MLTSRSKEKMSNGGWKAKFGLMNPGAFLEVLRGKHTTKLVEENIHSECKI